MYMHVHVCSNILLIICSLLSALIWLWFTLAMYLIAQIILAFGNYMNSSKRGGVYGFKVASLDMVSWPHKLIHSNRQ